MSSRPRLGAIALCAALFVMGVLGFVASVRTPSEHSVAPDVVTTPLLSIRRAPGALQLGVARERLRLRIDQVLSTSDLGEALKSSCAVARVAGGIVAVLGPTRTVTPASTLKVLTAVATLARVDPNERFLTTIRAAAPPIGGVLKGDLWIVGGGDPLLESAEYARTQIHEPELATSLDALADAVVAKGIVSVEGSLVGDDRRYDDVRFVKTWKRAYVRSGEVGPIGGLMIDDNFTRRTARGVRVAAEDVGADGAGAFQRLLEARGVTVVGAPRSARTGGAAPPTTVIAEASSIPIPEVVGEMLRWSDNSTAEMLVKELGFRDRGLGTAADGIAAIRASLALRGVDLRGMRTVDGSGLDRSDRVTCSLLAAAVATQPAGGPFVGGLPVMGRSGTLRRRLRGTEAAGRVVAKTGSLNGVSSLAGRATASDGTAIDFALVFNGLQSTAQGVTVGNAIAQVLVAFPDAPELEGLRPTTESP